MSIPASTLPASSSISPAPSHGAGTPVSRARLRTDLLIYVTLLVLTLSAWWISRQGWFTSWSRTGYWIGVAGGVAMVLLFAYPLRKRWRVTYNWGASRHWFVAHMVLGVLGPWLILLHSTFRIGSTNAAVALFSMVVVALSGVAGRFLYVRLHADLRGEKSSLNSLRAAMQSQHAETDAQLQTMPQVLKRLHDLETQALGTDPAHQIGHLWRMFVLPWRSQHVNQQCRADIRAAIKQATRQHKWTKSQALQRYRVYRQQVESYLLLVQRAAQFQTFERLFSMWHVAHVPFVWIMVLCAIFHVIAVHAY